MNSLRKTVTLALTCSRSVSQSAVLRASESAKFTTLKETQKSLNIDDGVPIYIKAGVKDKMLYQITLVLTAVGLSVAGHTMFLAFYPKNK